ncbi:MAG TPA: hypothetical protein VK886_18285 [Vicinamibacterales bacterium]|nr:hypothetical protein [Vicinamibacterales bacterium]
MHLSRAIEQIAEIHQQIAKGEVYRGYRPLPVACSGLAGIAAAALQPRGLGWNDPIGFVLYWMLTAVICGLIASSEIAHNYLLREGSRERRRTRRVVGQFVPALAAGAIVSGTFARFSPGFVPALPGLWALFFGLGIFASRPYLPRASGWVALFYFVAGVALLWFAPSAVTRSPWSVGGTFGAGQLLAALALYWNVERDEI